MICWYLGATQRRDSPSLPFPRPATRIQRGCQVQNPEVNPQGAKLQSPLGFLCLLGAISSSKRSCRASSLRGRPGASPQGKPKVSADPTDSAKPLRHGPGPQPRTTRVRTGCVRSTMKEMAQVAKSHTQNFGKCET